MRYRAHDLVTVPGLLTLARLPLAAVFVFASRWPLAGVAVLAAAAVTDMLDGWWARHFHQQSQTGAALDGLVDKLFALTVVVTLITRGMLGPWGVLMLTTREIGELPLAAWYWGHRAHVAQPKADTAGKLSTTLQFVSVTCILLSGPTFLTVALLAATGLEGTVAVIHYWIRAARVINRANG